MKTRMMAIVLACCSTMTAQISDYLGPGILTRGAGDIGTRAGQDVNLRVFGSVNGIYDTGLQPYSVDGAGHLVTVDGLYGVETALGVYGVHNFQHARLGLDYKGTTGITPAILSSMAPIIRWRLDTPTRNRGAWFSICVKRQERFRKALLSAPG